MKFDSPEEVRAHLKKVSISPVWTMAAYIVTSILISCVLVATVNSFIDLQWQKITASVSILISVFGLNFWYGKIEVPTASKGIITFLGSRCFEDYFLSGKKSVLGEGLHWLPPFLVSAITQTFTEQSEVLPRTLAKIQIHDNDKSKNPTAFQHTTFIDIAFSNLRFHFMVWNPWSFIDTGISGFTDELRSIIGEIIRDIGIHPDMNTVDIYSADINLEVLKGIRKSQRSGSIPEVDRWGIFPISVSIPSIDPDSEAVRVALEGEYQEILDRVRETNEAKTLGNIFSMLKEKSPTADDEFLFSIAMRMVRGLTVPGRDHFIYHNGNSGDGPNLGINAALLRLQQTQKEGGSGE